MGRSWSAPWLWKAALAGAVCAAGGVMWFARRAEDDGVVTAVAGSDAIASWVEGEGEGEGDGRACVAVRSGNDGFGAQYLRQMSGYALAASTGRAFCFVPFVQLEHVGGAAAAAEASAATGMGVLGCSRVRCNSVAVMGGGRALSLVFRTRGRGSEAGPTFPVSGPGVGRKSVTRMFGAGVTARLRRMYDAGREGAGRADGDEGPKGVRRVAVHIRRGDAPPSRRVGVEVYESIFRRLRARWPEAMIDVYSEGKDGWKEARWAAMLGSARLHIEEEDDDDDDEGDASKVRGPVVGMLRAHRAMVDADVLVVAKSTFSYSAALLSSGVVWALPFCGSASFCFPPLHRTTWHVICEAPAPPWCAAPGDVLDASRLDDAAIEAVRRASANAHTA